MFPFLKISLQLNISQGAADKEVKEGCDSCTDSEGTAR